jgi:LuxR family transcriptional regulator, quorum-sensing system regulator SdiA
MMPHNDTNVKQVKDKLKALSKLSDTGYLLAVHIRLTRPSLMFTTYPQVWLEHYGEKGMMMVDPVVRWAMSDSTEAGVAKWDDLTGDDPAGVVASAAAHGLKNGISFAIGPIQSRTIGSVTRSTAFTAAETATAKALVSEIHALTDGLEKMDTAIQNAMRAIG